MNKLYLIKHKFTLLFTEDSQLPPFIGNTIRGAIGQALHDNSSIAYNAIFKGTGGESKPNPFVISAPYPSQGEYKKGETLEFFITLFGNASNCYSDIVFAVKNMSRGKLENTTCYESREIYAKEWSDDGAESIPYCDFLEVEFITPTEIYHSKEPISKPDFTAFTDCLFGRIRGIIDNYTDCLFTVPYSLIAVRPHVKAEYDTKTVRFQTSGQPINGFLGTVRYSGDVTRYLPYIDLGSQILIGKKTTRSCGEYSFII
jgi:CRISPR-associated endoribonuclease Cas6